MHALKDLYAYRMDDVELRQLRCLVAIVDEGTFTDAAIALGVSQGLSVAPNTSLKVLAPAPNSGVFDLA